MTLPQLTARFGLPLLGKELIEQAARRRTYVLRVVYAVLLFGMALLMFRDIVRVAGTSPFAVLGRGKDMFEFLVSLQFAGVYLFMPAITCGVLAQEKERNSLMLLFLTKLGPWTILFEKLLSRIVPMCCFLLMSLPLLAYAYTLGGITSDYLWAGVWMLFVVVLQCGTTALMCSAYYRTTVGAFIASYVLLLAMMFGPAFASMPFMAGRGATASGVMAVFPFFPPMLFLAAGWGSGMAVAASIPTVVVSGVFFLLARAFVVRRAFLGPRNVLLAAFRGADRLFARLNDNRVTRGIVLIRDTGALPESHPIAWRETTKRSLGQARYLIRLFVALEGPLVLICAVLVMFDVEGATSPLLFILWGLAVLIVSVQSASLVAGERTHQTLDVLCTIPQSGRSILLQKFRGVRRLILVLAVPLWTIFFLNVVWEFGGGRSWRYGRTVDPPLYLACSLLSVAIYLPLAAWLSLLIGLKVKAQSRAIVAALAAIVGWCILPLVFIFSLAVILFERVSSNSPLTLALLSSPATIVALNEYNDLNEIAQAPWRAVLINFLGYGFALFAIRQYCLHNADRLLGRAETVDP